MVQITITSKQLEKFGKGINFAISEQIAQAVRKEIEKMKLIQSTQFWQSIQVLPNGEGVYSDVPYAQYLEYGTMEYWNNYGSDDFPKTPHPKKKHMTREQAKAYPAGMQPFAPFRRVVYNPNKMVDIVARAIRNL